MAFYPGKDIRFFTKKLNEDLIKFFSPWLDNAGSELRFGGQFHSALAIHFIEKLDYVDYIIDFYLEHEGNRVEEVVATRSSAVLVSATQHDIKGIQR